ncbi:COPII coat assembly protein SEC16 [Fusarium fujikuroi]|nr:COPII coat assembly protein SEC16 [Fusarium fujikuroi]
MASESPKATDLATMPNHPDPTSSTQAPAHATSSTTPDAVVQADVPTSPDVSSQQDQKSSEQDGAANAWPSHEDDGHDSNDWLASDDAVPNQTQEETASNEPELDVASQPKAPVSQHSSSMSFARTVSHEISFGDEEEGEWNLSRTDTDPFKFMPPTDRTNSFPPVPPAHTNSEVEDQQPLASNQALDVLEEIEKEADAEEELYQREETTDGLEAPRRGHSSSISIGGDLKSPEGQDSDERYEEGMPLIPPPEEERHKPSSGLRTAI